MPPTYQSDEPPHVRLTKLETDYVGGEKSGFDWGGARLTSGSALARPGGPASSLPPQNEQLEVRLTLRGNANAVKHLAAFFGLYGEDAEFRSRGFLPTSAEVMALPPHVPEEMEGEVVEADGPPDVVEGEFVEPGEDDDG